MTLLLMLFIIGFCIGTVIGIFYPLVKHVAKEPRRLLEAIALWIMAALFIWFIRKI